jgi:hypothetical protein
MPRGQSAPLGTETTNKNGYVQVKTEEGWVGKHVLVAEAQLGRKLGKGERVRFKDGDRQNLSADNLVVEVLKSAQGAKRVAELESRIADLTAMLNYEKEILAKAAEAAKRG